MPAIFGGRALRYNGYQRGPAMIVPYVNTQEISGLGVDQLAPMEESVDDTPTILQMNKEKMKMLKEMGKPQLKSKNKLSGKGMNIIKNLAA